MPPFEITPDIVLRAYAAGLFPMAESADDPQLFWVDPDQRGVFMLDDMSISRSLAKAVRADRFDVRVDGDFDAVIDACAESRPDREQTWINRRIRKLYRALFEAGHVHTVECRQAGALVGGLYGVSLGGIFFGESMFHRATDASKIALVHLAARLIAGGYLFIDAQFLTPHLATLGAIEIPKATYRTLLAQGLARDGDFYAWPREREMRGADALSVVRDGRDAPSSP